MTGPLTRKNATYWVGVVLARAAIRDFARGIRSTRAKGKLHTTIYLRSWADLERMLAVLDNLPGSTARRQSAETIVVAWDSDTVDAE